MNEESLLNLCLKASEKNDIAFFEKNIENITKNIADLVKDKQFYQIQLNFLLFLFSKIDFSAIGKQGFDVLKLFLDSTIDKYKKEKDIIFLLSSMKIKQKNNFICDQYIQLLKCFNNFTFCKFSAETFEGLKNQLNEKDQQILRLQAIAKSLQEENNLLKGISSNDDSNELEMDIFKAAKEGKIKSIEALINDYNADINAKNSDEDTPLHLAAFYNHIDIVEFLCEHKADIELQNKKGYTPLHSACDRGHLTIVEYLVETCKANIFAKSFEGKIPIHIASQWGRIEVIKYFANMIIDGKPFDLEVTDNSGRTPFYLTIQYNHIDSAKYLIHEKNVNIETRNIYDNTALHVASMNGYIAIVRYYFEVLHQDPNIRGYNDRTLLHVAANNNRFEVATYLIEQQNFDVNDLDRLGETPLHCACHYDNEKMVQLLLDKGADPTVVDKIGKTPLHIACEYGNVNCVSVLLSQLPSKDGIPELPKDYTGKTPLHIVCEKGIISIIDYLIQNAKISPELADNQGYTLLHVSCLANQIESIQYLLKNAKCNKEARDFSGKTALILSCEIAKPETVELLLKNNLDVSAFDNKGYTALYFACKENKLDVVKMLINARADVNQACVTSLTTYSPLMISCKNGNLEITKTLVENKADVKFHSKTETILSSAIDGDSLDCFKVILDSGASPSEIINERGFTIMHYACQQGKLKFVEELYERKADINALTEGYWDDDTYKSGYYSPLHLACKAKSYDVARFLISKGARIDTTTFTEKLPLHYACESGNPDLVTFLIASGSPINAKDYNGKTPLHYARKNGFDNIVQYLTANGAQSETNEQSNGSIFKGSALLNIFKLPSNMPTVNRMLNASKIGISKDAIQNQTTNTISQNVFPQTAAQTRTPQNTLSYGFGNEMHQSRLNFKGINVLIKANPSLVDLKLDGKYPIHIAIEKKSIEVANDIINNNGDVNALNDDGETPLHIAAKMNWKFGVENLLKHNADKSIRNKDGKTAFDLTTDPNIQKLLV